jgi:hypothetical protein
MGILTGQGVGTTTTGSPELGEVPLLVDPLIERVLVFLGLAGEPVTNGALPAPLILPLFLQFIG